MKRKIQPTQYERKLKENDFIVSKTDTSGRITYCNQIFMEIAGYEEEELLGVQHNIIRHPDMPRGVFQFMWDEIKKGNEFFGYVKNMSSDGGFYWVFANITPSTDANGQTVGYYSVRRRPKESAINVVKQVYAEMMTAEDRAGPKDAIAASTQLLFDKLAALGTDYDHFVLEI